ncbi:MAG: hypothetical protein H0W40_11410 [Methylibium sp.]|uniref:hypothetical protein n=1 Tax=Methylibium sp. TaxID=2067992 RepID=UPI0017CB2678|nr:hypothetical protein [Methylibium sp.]MBA3597965.1 hypothetical protein [Methylibium sp.]
MNAKQVAGADDVLSWLSEQASCLPEARENAVQMTVVLTMARLYLVEFATHLSRGMEPYDALKATANGELEFTQRQQDLWRVVRPPLE